MSKLNKLNERLDALRQLVQSDDFLNGKGLSNEVNIRIFCYDPKDEMTVRHFTKKLTESADMGGRIIEHNLYRVFLDICEDKRITDKIPALEQKKGPAFILQHLARIANNLAFIEKMKAAPHHLGDVILITGVGEAFPFIRVHSLLDAMQPHFSDVPILVMYPGTFDGRCVRLFDRLTPNPYYRAFKVV